MRFLHNLEASDIIRLNHLISSVGGAALFGVHLFYFGKTPAVRRARTEEICRIAAAHPTNPLGLDVDAMAAQLEAYHEGLFKALDMDLPVGFMLEGLDVDCPQAEAEARLRPAYDHLESLDRSGREWIVVPTHPTSAQPLYQDWQRFVGTVYGQLGVRLPVLCGCSLLTEPDGTVIPPEGDIYACVNDLAFVLHESECFDEVKWEPAAVHTRVLPFNPFR